MQGIESIYPTQTTDTLRLDSHPKPSQRNPAAGFR